jgi:iron complex outermembrane receptor protein
MGGYVLNQIYRAFASVSVLALIGMPSLARAQAAQPADTAQTEAATDSSGADSKQIVVTGSISRNPATSTASPIVSLSSDDLSKRGINSVTDALLATAANNAGSLASSWSAQGGFATGASAASLRGLNDAYTLTVFDGLRTAVYPLADDGYRNFVDLNTIPDSIVERVDVLQDGASSTYGADAVAGVINVRIKHEITGFHGGASAGISERGDSGERRVDATLGFGKLKENGYNFYVNAEYQINDPLFLRDRGFPYGTSDQSRICTNGGALCRTNNVANGIQSTGAYNGFNDTIVGFARPYDTIGGNEFGQLQLLSPPAGCRGLTARALTPGNVAGLDPDTAASLPSVVCQQDFTNQYTQYSPKLERVGANARFTKELGNSEAYVMVNFLQTRTAQSSSPLNFAGQTANGDVVQTLSPLILPIYVCSNGVGNVDPTMTGCNAGNGRLNPNNPFAAAGQYASLHQINDRPTATETIARSFRISGGIAGTIGDKLGYSIDATTSWLTLYDRQLNYINAQHLLNLVATGGFNFVNPDANSQAVRDYLSPPSTTRSISKLTQVQATLNRDLFALPGGAINVAVGAAYRFEGLNNPSANPANPANSFDRYYTINAVGAVGARRVYSGFYEITAPVLSVLKLKADGRYDDYSSGQRNFSPKFEAEFKPVDFLKIRGTYSRGIRIASFNQAYGLPTTGFITVSSFNCTTYASFCAAHASNPTYYTGGYSYGLTAVGNSKVSPEKSRSFTGGVVFTPTRNITFTADYWNIQIKNIIVSLTGSDISSVLSQYYGNNGVVNVPGVTSVIKGTPDPLNPTALPLINSFSSGYKNANSEKASGLDFSGAVRFPIGSSGIQFTSQANASVLLNLALNNGGNIERYDGTLGPCNITSCSGAPRVRGNWSNTLDFNGRGSMTLTANYTSGYSEVATDFGGIYGDCAGSVGAAVAAYSDGTTPVICNTHATVTVDLDMRAKVQDRFTFYIDVKNLLNSKPIYDPSAAYGITQFNPAWGDSNFVGRFFRVGVKVDL